MLLWPLGGDDEQLVYLPIGHLPFRFFIPWLGIAVAGRTGEENIFLGGVEGARFVNNRAGAGD